MARLYADENFSRRVVENLRELGHDVLTTTEAGKSNQKISDEDVLTLATELKRSVLTFNRNHFIRLHDQGVQHAGIIVCTEDPNVNALAQRIHDVLAAHHDLTNQLVRVIRPNQ